GGPLSSNRTRSAWDRAPVLLKTCFRCVRTVLWVTPRSSATSVIDLPPEREQRHLGFPGGQAVQTVDNQAQTWRELLQGSVMKATAAGRPFTRGRPPACSGVTSTPNGRLDDIRDTSSAPPHRPSPLRLQASRTRRCRPVDSAARAATRWPRRKKRPSPRPSIDWAA